jgi:uncharacterized membrane protein
VLGQIERVLPRGLKPGVIFVDFDVRAKARTLQTDPLPIGDFEASVRGQTMAIPNQVQEHSHVQDHIETIAKHEQEFLARRSPAERLGDLTAAIVGNLGFVAAHIVLFFFWILVNTLHLAGIPHFDPMPFSLLGTVVAMEAILLASLILMRQSRLARRADEREHLVLQILLLTEKEVTAVIGMNQQIAKKVGLSDMKDSENIEQLSRNTSVDEVAQDIQKSLSEDV